MNNSLFLDEPEIHNGSNREQSPTQSDINFIDDSEIPPQTSSSKKGKRKANTTKNEPSKERRLSQPLESTLEEEPQPTASKKRKDKRWQFNVRRILLTWAALHKKPTIDEWLDAMTHLPYKLASFCACFERHKQEESNGAWHIHMLGILNLDGKKRVNIRNQSAFDVRLDDHNYHPQWQPVRSLGDTWDYVHKTGVHLVHRQGATAGCCKPDCTQSGRLKGEVHCNGDPHDHEDWTPETTQWIRLLDPKKKNPSADTHSMWSALTDCPTKSQFLDAITEMAPRQMMFNHGNIMAFADRKYAEENNNLDYASSYNTESFHDISVIRNFMNRFVTNRPDDRQRCPSLCIVGPSGIGKTELIRTFGKHSYHGGRFHGPCINEEALYNVFDSVRWRDFSNQGTYKSWMGGERTVAFRYKYHKKSITWGRPSIFVCNPEEDPENFISGKRPLLDASFIKKNLIICKFGEERWFRKNSEAKVEIFPSVIKFHENMACNIDLDFLLN